MCLDKSAHGVVPQHEIFNKPFKVDIQYDTVPTPEEYGNRGLKPGDPLKVWHVQTKGFSTKDASAGVVSMGDGFADSPDAEYISGGVNHKLPTACAIGRHGPFFLWGFSAAPEDMTESGRMAFLNSVVYAAKFDRAPLLVRLNMSSRDRVPWMIGFLENGKHMHAKMTEFNKNYNEKVKAVREKAKSAPGELTAEEKRYVNGREQPPVKSYEVYNLDQAKRFFPADVVKEFGIDAAKYHAWFKENRPYLFASRRFWAEVDNDAKALGIANNDPKLLDLCIANLEQGKDVARSKRLLERYTTESYATPAEWRSWLNASKSDLFFSDVGGFKYFAKSGEDAAHRRGVMATAIDEPTTESPVSCSATIRPGTVMEGDVFTIAVRMRIAPGWHTCAEAGPEESSRPTKIDVKLPEGIEAAGEWRLPPATPQKNGSTYYTDDAVFLRTCKLKTVKPGTVEIPVTVSYVACDEERCLPPVPVKLKAQVKVIPNPMMRRAAAAE